MQAATRFYENTTMSVAYSIACTTGQFKESRGGWNSKYFMSSLLKTPDDSDSSHHIHSVGNDSALSNRQDSILMGLHIIDYYIHESIINHSQRSNKMRKKNVEKIIELTNILMTLYSFCTQANL